MYSVIPWKRWRDCIFELCGVKEFYRKTYGVVVTSSLAQRKAWLEDVRETVVRYFPEKGDY
jgi:NAD(P)H dehydrogenase (quinone)